MNIEIVNLIYVDAVWDRVRPLFAEAIEEHGDDFSAGELWQMCRSGHAFLLIVRDGEDIKASVAVRFDKWSKGSILRVLAAGGVGLEEWKSAIRDFVYRMGKENGAKRVVAEGRLGWSRIFEELELLRCTYVMEIK